MATRGIIARAAEEGKPVADIFCLLILKDVECTIMFKRPLLLFVMQTPPVHVDVARIARLSTMIPVKILLTFGDLLDDSSVPLGLATFKGRKGVRDIYIEDEGKDLEDALTHEHWIRE